MAHFAKVDENNLVTEVIVIDNAVVDPEGKGNDNETLGQTYIADVLGLEGNWQQCSYNNNIRGNYAGIGFTWDADNQIFWPPQPYPSWTKNTTTAMWDCPLGAPPSLPDEQVSQNIAGTHDWEYRWNETLHQGDNTKGWELTDHLA